MSWSARLHALLQETGQNPDSIGTQTHVYVQCSTDWTTDSDRLVMGIGAILGNWCLVMVDMWNVEATWHLIVWKK